MTHQELIQILLMILFSKKFKKFKIKKVIKIILFCISTQQRFNEVDGKLIQKIMKLYPFNDLPVIIVILQSYFKEASKKTIEETKKTLLKYLDKEIVN